MRKWNNHWNDGTTAMLSSLISERLFCREAVRNTA